VGCRRKEEKGGKRKTDENFYLEACTELGPQTTTTTKIAL